MSDKIIGRNPVLEAIKAGRDIDKIFVKKGKPEGSLVPLIRKARDKGIVISEVDRQKLDELSAGEIIKCKVIGYDDFDMVVEVI